MAVSYGEGGKLILLAAATDAVTGLFFVKDIRWIKPTAAGHGLVVTNNATDDDIVASATADAANSDQTICINDWVNGLYIKTLGSGSVEVRIG